MSIVDMSEFLFPKPARQSHQILKVLLAGKNPSSCHGRVILNELAKIRARDPMNFGLRKLFFQSARNTEALKNITKTGKSND